MILVCFDEKVTFLIIGKSFDIMIKNILKFVLVVGTLAVFVSCGTKKVEPKADHSKVDEAYEEYNNKNK